MNKAPVSESDNASIKGLRILFDHIEKNKLRRRPMVVMDQLIHQLENGERGERVCDKATASLFDVFIVTEEKERLALCLALLSCPTPPSIDNGSSFLIISRAMETAAECVPALFQAGFTLADTPPNRIELATYIGKGLWPVPELISPGLLHTDQAGRMVDGLIYNLMTYENNVEALRALDRIEAWQKQCGATELGGALTQGFALAMRSRTLSQGLAQWHEPGIAVFARLIDMGMNPEPGLTDVLKEDRVSGEHIEYMLAQSLHLNLERETAQASLPSRPGPRL